MSHKDNGAPFRASMSDRVWVRAWCGAVLLNGGGMGCLVPVIGSAPGCSFVESPGAGPYSSVCSVVSYSPAPWRVQYHRRCQA